MQPITIFAVSFCILSNSAFSYWVQLSQIESPYSNLGLIKLKYIISKDFILIYIKGLRQLGVTKYCIEHCRTGRCVSFDLKLPLSLSLSLSLAETPYFGRYIPIFTKYAYLKIIEHLNNIHLLITCCH